MKAPHKLSSFGMFAMGFGQIVGVGWIIIMGDWLSFAGPGGTILVLLVGGMLLLSVGLCYGLINRRIKKPGGEIAYAAEVFGLRASFIVGWFLSLFAVAIVAFLSISFGWITSKLLGLAQSVVAYEVLGEPVYSHQALISAAGLAVVVVANYLGIRSAGNFQSVATALLLLSAAVMIVAGLAAGSAEHLTPLFLPAEGESVVTGLLRVLVTVPFFFAGFQIIPQLVENAPTDSRVSTGQIILVSLLGAGLFYSGITLAVSLTAPWQTIVDAELPVHYAFSRLPLGAWLGTLVLAAGTLGILTTWNSAFVWALKLLNALALKHFIPQAFREPLAGHRGSVAGVLLVGLCGVVALLLGRSFILPIVNFAAAAIAAAMLTTSLCVWRLTKAQGTEDLPGGRFTIACAIATSAFMLGLAVYEPFRDTGALLPPEAWVFFIWFAAGALFWRMSRALRTSPEGEVAVEGQV